MHHAAAGRPDPYGSAGDVINRWKQVMRIRFLSYLAMGVISGFLIIASYAFADGTFMWLAFAGGVAFALIGAIDAVNSRRRALTAVPAGAIAIVGAVMAVLALTLANADIPDIAFGLSIATAILSILGLWSHELEAEHDVSALAEPRAAR